MRGEASGPVSILLVDDEPGGLLALEETLAPLGQRMVEARSGGDALRRILHEDFALILLDVMMPGMDGFEAARLIRSRPRSQNVPIIFLTALNSGDPPEREAYAVGAVDYVCKPFQPEVLRSKVRVFVELAKRTQELRESNTRLRSANRQLREEQLRVAQAERLASVGLLAAGVAHEINNPLMGALNCLALLKDGKAREERRAVYFDTIGRALEQIGSTVRALLRYARERPEEMGPVDLGECVASCVALLAPVLRTRKVEILQRVARAEAVALGNASQLRQAAMNVLLNAVQASQAGAQVTVSAHVQGERVGLVFEDTGTGIAPAELRRVCDPFFTTKPEGEGSGLGLAVTQGILAAHNGELKIESQLGAGTQVTFWLPHFDPAAAGLSSPAPARCAQEVSGPAPESDEPPPKSAKRPATGPGPVEGTPHA